MAFTPPRQPATRRVRRRAVLRRLRPQLHLGHGARPDGSCPTRPRSGRSEPARRCPWTSSSAPAATCSTPTSRAARSSGSTTPTATRRRRRWPRASPTTARRRSPSRSTARARAIPTRRLALLRLGPGRRRRSSTMPTAASRATPTRSPGTYTVGLRVTDPRRHGHRLRRHHGRQHAAHGHDRVPHRRAHVEGRRPDRLHRQRTDAQDGALPASALSWSCALEHCPSGCHEHALQTFDGVDHGSFAAPDHEYPSYLELTLTVPRQRRPDRQPHDPPGPEDRGHLARLRPGRARPRLQRRAAARAVHPSVIQGSQTRCPPRRRRRSPGRSSTSARGRTAASPRTRSPPVRTPDSRQAMLHASRDRVRLTRIWA